MRNLTLALIMFILNSGCAYQIQKVPYGLDEMPPADRKVVNQVLNDVPVCQRWSWTNEHIGRSYTVMAVSEYQSDINTRCKIFSVDTAYQMGSPYRGNATVIERACKKSYDTHWVYEPTNAIWGIKWDGDLRYFTENNTNARCATRSR